MSHILSRLAAIGIIAGGFALTGDLGRLAQRGFEVVNARDVPTADDEPAESADLEPAAEAARGPAPADQPEPRPGARASTPAAPAAPGSPPAPVRHAEFRPPRDGIEQVSLAALDAGDRVVVWLALPRRSGGHAYRCLVFDLVDPNTGEALAYEAVSFSADGSPQATAVTPHRVRLQGDGLGGAVVKGGMIDLGRRGIAAAGVGHEAVGPVVALHLVR